MFVAILWIIKSYGVLKILTMKYEKINIHDVKASKSTYKSI